MKKALALLSITCAIVSATPNGEEIFKQCAICHGDHAQKRSLNVSAVIAGMDAKQIVKTLKSYQAGELNQYGFGNMMQGQATKLSAEEMQAVARYVASLRPEKAAENQEKASTESKASQEELEYNNFVESYFKANTNATFAEVKQKWQERQTKMQ